MSDHAVGRQVARFAAAGVINTLLDYVLFVALTSLWALPLDRAWIAKAISGAVAISNSFVLNRLWVFRGTSTRPAPGQARQQLARFVLVTLFGTFVVQLGGLHLLTAVWPAPGQVAARVIAALGLGQALGTSLVIRTVAFGLATLASMTWNFLAYRSWVFAAADTEPGAAPIAQRAG